MIFCLKKIWISLRQSRRSGFCGTTVAVVGAGALGQMTAHQLVRSGFEKLILIDKDVLEYSNFNRQLYALDSTVNQSKAEVLKAGLMDIWPQADIRVCETFLDECNGKALASGADLLMDCVDNADTKVCLEKLAAELKIPLVHGAVEGWYGQAATIFPGDALLERLYVNRKKQETAWLLMPDGLHDRGAADGEAAENWRRGSENRCAGACCLWTC